MFLSIYVATSGVVLAYNPFDSTFGRGNISVDSRSECYERCRHMGSKEPESSCYIKCDSNSTVVHDIYEECGPHDRDCVNEKLDSQKYTYAFLAAGVAFLAPFFIHDTYGLGVNMVEDKMGLSVAFGKRWMTDKKYGVYHGLVLENKPLNHKYRWSIDVPIQCDIKVNNTLNMLAGGYVGMSPDTFDGGPLVGVRANLRQQIALNTNIKYSLERQENIIQFIILFQR